MQCITCLPSAGRRASLACLQQHLHSRLVASVCGLHERGHARLVLKGGVRGGHSSSSWHSRRPSGEGRVMAWDRRGESLGGRDSLRERTHAVSVS